MKEISNKSDTGKVIKNPEDSTSISEECLMDFGTAKEILRKIADKHEDTINQNNLADTGDFPIEKTRKAFKTVFQSNLERHPEQVTATDRRVTIQKRDEKNGVQVSLEEDYIYLMEEPADRSSTFVSVPLEDSPSAFSTYIDENDKAARTGWVDTPNADAYRHTWRGIRLLAANMADWDGPYISPEALDKKDSKSQITFTKKD